METPEEKRKRKEENSILILKWIFKYGLIPVILGLTVIKIIELCQ